MLEILFWIAVAMVACGAYYIILQPYIAKAWSWLKANIGTRKDNG